VSPPLRFATVEDVRVWQTAGRRVVAFVPEFDDFLPPQAAREAFAVAPAIDVVAVPDAKHLWVGERFVGNVLSRIVQVIEPDSEDLPSHWTGPMDKWSDLA